MKRHLHILLACALLLTACGGPAASSSAASSAAVSEPAVSEPIVQPAVSEPVDVTPEEEIKVEMEFTGTVLALTPTTVLVKVDDECELHETSDQVTFKTKGLEAIEIAEGDRVWVGCTASVRETYPAQVEALTWIVLPGQSGEPEFAEQLVSYDASGDAMSIVVPIGWAYEQSETLAEVDPIDPAAAETPDILSATIALWPVDDPECRVRLMVEQAAPGIDINAVTAEERAFEKAGAATVYTQEHDGGHWIYVQFATEDGRYSVRWAPTADQKTAHEETFWSIVESVTVGNEV